MTGEGQLALRQFISRGNSCQQKSYCKTFDGKVLPKFTRQCFEGDDKLVNLGGVPRRRVRPDVTRHCKTNPGITGFVLNYVLLLCCLLPS